MRRSDVLTDGILLLAALAVVVADQWIKEIYNQLNSPFPLLVSILWVIGLVLVLLLAVRVSAATAIACRSLIFVVLVTVWAYFFGSAPSSVGFFVGALVLAAGCAGFVKLSFALPQELWRKIRRAALFGLGVLVLSGPLLGTLLSPAISWPPAREEEGPSLAIPSDRAVVFLLLDELAAEAAKPIVDVMRQGFASVSLTSVPAVGDMTAKVVPEMFTGRRFSSARPCWVTTVCDHSHSLDFARISASRRDVDVVGFYHPYCAIRGLRWCVQASPPEDAASLRRWVCAAERFMNLRRQSDECRAVPIERAAALNESLINSLEGAPFWTSGGLLFAHISLPHPPGITPGASLDTHYAENVQRSVTLVQRLVRSGKERFGEKFVLIVFSDHPLRYKGACRSVIYAATECNLRPVFMDSKVPIAVGADRRVDLSSITDNGQIFQLLSLRSL